MAPEELDNIDKEELPKNEDILELDTDPNGHKGEPVHHMIRISGLYQDWFLDYASYVILERAVPHLNDGLKPVQRRILHAMKRLDDGRYNKVANIIGHTMQYHPHGDASIGDALVQLGQKDLLIDTQGNWGNIYTGDASAAPRYIEARLTKFALEVIFNPKTTTWKSSYDGRNKEPITLPVKFPLLLAQGVEGIAVGLASKILPHNFIELIDASIAHLQKKSFELYPDFPTGGLVDVSKYNDGVRGGSIRIRAKINKLDKKSLVINEVPYGKTTSSLIESILKANDKGKIKIKKIDDNTAENVEIIIEVASGVSLDKTIDALYAFTDCEIPVSPNSCIISNDKPQFLGVSEILRISVQNTIDLLKKELEIRLGELKNELHAASLEKIFIENEIYQQIKGCKTEDEMYKTINDGLQPFIKKVVREIVHEDLVKLSNIPVKRIAKYNSFKADEHIKDIKGEIAEVKNHLNNLVDFAINYYRQIKKKYSKGRERKTEIRNFDTIEATRVAVANEKLFVNREEGFIGTSLKKDEFVCECSDIDDILAIRDDGIYMITKASDKVFVGKNLIHVAVFKKNDNRTIYNVVYRDGLNGNIMMKRCAITGLTRDKEYTLTKGTQRSKILYLSANPNGESEVINVKLKPRPRLKNTLLEIDFAELAIKGKNSQGNILTRYAIHRISLKEKGASTLGGRKRWFDEEVRRLNADGKGTFLGEFNDDEKILVVTRAGKFRLSSFDLQNHFEDDVFKVERFNPKKVFATVYYDADQKYYYVKRFTFDKVDELESFIGDNPKSKLITFTELEYPRLEIKFGGKNKGRDPEIIEVAEFINVKRFKARGKRLTKYQVAKVVELEPITPPEPEPEDESPLNSSEPQTDIEEKKENGQMTLEL